MWQKLIAATFCLSGACGFGYSLCREMSRDIYELKIEKQMLSYVVGEISYLHRPLGEIFDILANRIEPPFGIFLGDVSGEMRKRSGRSLKGIWKACVGNLRKEYAITAIGAAYLERMADCFGFEGDMIQVESFDLLVCEISQEIEQLVEKKRENGRLIKILSTLTGVLCVVLFL